MFKAIGLLLVAIVFAGCTNNSRPLPPEGHRYVEGSVLQVAKENYKSLALEECDRRFKDRVLSLAREVDEKQPLIQRLRKELKGEGLPPEVRIGGYRFFDFEYKAEKPGWQSKRRSWQTLFDKIDKKPKEQRDWLSIDRFVRAHIVDDETRLQFYGYPGLNRKNGPQLLEIFEKVEQCYKVKCRTLNLSWEEENLLRQGWAYREILFAFRNTNDQEEWLGYLYKRLRAETGRYKFRVNPSIKQSAPGVFAMPINPGSLAKGVSMFSHFMRYWDDGVKRVNLLPKASNSEFKIIMHNTGGRANVMWDEKTVNIFPNETLKTIAHELGHVLGFKDAYYTSFDANTCEYETEFNGEDIMSDHNSGIVRAHHWETLNKHYPVRR